MSQRHGWLTFTTGGPALARRPDQDPLPWQQALSALHSRWYDGVAPPAVAAVFVLQFLLQVPAHTAAHAAASGPWRVPDLADLTFTTGGALVPERVRLARVTAAEGDLAQRLTLAEDDYRAVAEPLAREYPAQVRLGAHTRSALVDDMWAEARRGAETAAGVLRTDAPTRASCCLIYALPGCTECAGCPRNGPAPRKG